MNSAQRLSPRQERDQISMDLSVLAGRAQKQLALDALREIKARIKVLRKAFAQDQYRQLILEAESLHLILQSHRMTFHAEIARQLLQEAKARKTIEVAAILHRLERNIRIAVAEGGLVLSTQV